MLVSEPLSSTASVRDWTVYASSMALIVILRSEIVMKGESFAGVGCIKTDEARKNHNQKNRVSEGMLNSKFTQNHERVHASSRRDSGLLVPP